MVALLTTLAQSGHAWIQAGTLILVAATGFFNWAATWNASDRNKLELETNRRIGWESEQRIRDEMRKQLTEVHDWIRESRDDFSRGNQDSAENRKMLTTVIQDLNGIERKLNKQPP
jgi:hypothetical protein